MSEWKEGLKQNEKEGAGVRERETESEEEREGNPRYVFPVLLHRFKFLDLIIRLQEACINIEKAFCYA